MSFGAGFFGNKVTGPAEEVIPWWLSGGISAENAIAVYQPKGAASYAASKVNLADPGNDLTEGSAPTWDSDNGWTFNGTNNHLNTNIVHGDTGQNWSAIVRFTDAVDGHFFSDRNSNISGFGIVAGAVGYRRYNNSGSLIKSGVTASGVRAIAGNVGYLDGVSEGTIPTSSQTNAEIRIGRRGGGSVYYDGKMQAIAFYDTVLTEAQIQAVTAAMQAL